MEGTGKTFKRLVLAAGVAAIGAVSAPASADMETLLDKLHEKGVLSDEDYQQMRTEARAERRSQALKDAKEEEKKQQPAPDSTRFRMAEAMKSVELYGDIRLRYEDRIATSPSDVNYDRQRWRYALRIGVRGDLTSDFFYGLRLDTNTYGRSAWVTFADDNANQGGKTSQANKTNDVVSVGLVYLGWKPTNWLQIVGGRQPNPMFTTPMVWDPDISPEGLSEKLNFNLTDNFSLFGTGGQFIYQAFVSPSTRDSDLSVGRQNLMLYTFEAGANYKLSELSAVRGAVNYYRYAGGQGTADYRSTFTGTGTGYAGNIGVNDLEIIEVPIEFRFPVGSLSTAVYGNFAKNLQGSDRAARAGFSSYGGQDKAYQLGLSLGSQGIPQGAAAGATYGSSAKKGTWETRVYYQRIDQFALDPNMIDSDFFERTNMEGWFAALAYSPADAIITTLRYGNAKRANDNLGTGGFNDDSSGANASIDKYKLLQLDVTLRF
ncbi:MAG TPA: putative porin [Burkholderiales bacterium]|nr:putative porin [Burkholderiales bacterium]